MSEVWSRHFGYTQLQGLLRVGDVYLPAFEDLPSFSQSGCIAHVDVMLDGLAEDDRKALGWLLWVARFTPAFLLHRLAAMLDHHERYPEPVAAGLRLLGLALKGLVTSLYYSGLDRDADGRSAVFAGLEYNVHCGRDND